jgi:hypothetical protein
LLSKVQNSLYRSGEVKTMEVHLEVVIVSKGRVRVVETIRVFLEAT